jgi:2,5-dichloro-2,5-cyclohexadiene-1,4-diol dehydrogenase 1
VISALSNKIGLVTGSGQGIGRAIALSFAREGAKSIRINAVSPGVILTPGLEQYFEEQPDKAEGLRKKSVMNRLGSPEEIADAVSFLSSDRASFITGQILSVDGGSSVC